MHHLANVIEEALQVGRVSKISVAVEHLVAISIDKGVI